MTTATEESKSWPWWWSEDQERYRGPCASRADAILEAWSEDNHGTVYVAQASQGPLNSDLFDSERIAELFDDANEEAGDPDGDGIAASFPDKAWDGLAARLNFVVKSFVREHGVQTWQFSGMVGEEEIDLGAGYLHTLSFDARLAVLQLIDDLRYAGNEALIATRLESLRAAIADKPPADL